MTKDLAIEDRAILIGFTSQDECVYSSDMPLDEYWDGEHVWDQSEGVTNLKLHRLVGFLFGSSGKLLQHFETIFDEQTGIAKSGWAQHEDGTFTHF